MIDGFGLPVASQQHTKAFSRSMILMISSSTCGREHSGSCLYALPAHSTPWSLFPSSGLHGISTLAIHEMCSILSSLHCPNTAFAHFTELHFFANQGINTGEFIALVLPVMVQDSCYNRVCPGTHGTPAAVRNSYSTHNN